eukprot:COSAG03_NODE_14397_length_465_cov_1.530055_1_plen_21_part_10
MEVYITRRLQLPSHSLTHALA